MSSQFNKKLSKKGEIEFAALGEPLLWRARECGAQLSLQSGQCWPIESFVSALSWLPVGSLQVLKISFFILFKQKEVREEGRTSLSLVCLVPGRNESHGRAQ